MGQRSTTETGNAAAEWKLAASVRWMEFRELATQSLVHAIETARY